LRRQISDHPRLQAALLGCSRTLSTLRASELAFIADWPNPGGAGPLKTSPFTQRSVPGIKESLDQFNKYML
jgi:hypothetical protein